MSTQESQTTPNGMRIVKGKERSKTAQPVPAVVPSMAWMEFVRARTEEKKNLSVAAAKTETYADLMELLEIERASLAEATKSKDIPGMPQGMINEVIKDSNEMIANYQRLQKEAETESSSAIKLEALKVIAKRQLTKQRIQEISAWSVSVERMEDARMNLLAFAEGAVADGLLKQDSVKPTFMIKGRGYCHAFDRAQELVDAMNTYADKIKETAKERRQSYEDQMKPFLMLFEDTRRFREEGAKTLKAFLANSGMEPYVLRVPYMDQMARREKFGDALLEKEKSGKIFTRKVTQADLARILFSHRKGDEMVFEKRRYVTFDEKSMAFADKLLTAAKHRALKREEELERDRAETTRLMDVSAIPDAITEAELLGGKEGTVPYHVTGWIINHGTDREREVLLTFHIRGRMVDGKMCVRVTDATSKTMEYARFLEGYTTNDVPLQTFLQDGRMKVIRSQNYQFWETRWTLERYCRENGIEDDAFSVQAVLDPAAADLEKAARVGIQLVWYEWAQRKPYQVGVVMERTGQNVTVVWAAPGYSSSMMKDDLEKTYPLTEITSNRLRTFCRIALQKILGISKGDIPDHFQKIQQEASSEKEGGGQEEEPGEPAPKAAGA